MPELQSNLWKSWDPRTEKEFGEDLAKMAELKDLNFSVLAEHAAKVEAAPSQRETNSAVAEAASALNRTQAEVLPALRVCTFFLKQFQSSGKAHDDDPSAIASDLALLKALPESLVKDFPKFLSALKREVEGWLDIGSLKRRVAHRGMAHLSEIGTAADFRAVFRERFNVETDFNHYNPTCLGVVPVGLISLGFDEGPVEDIAFQVDRRTLALLINHLRALEKELLIGQETLGLEEPEDDEGRAGGG